jgi:serine/threonine protein kinase
MFQAVNPGLQDPRLQALSDLKAVAQGGFAQVFRARWGDNPVALKLQALSSEELKQRFRREVHALSQLENPFIVRIHAAGDYQGWGWLILEWCEGPTLRSLVDEASARGDFVAEDWLFQRFTELAEALQAVHALGPGPSRCQAREHCHIGLRNGGGESRSC